jgi:hypothetical protein
MAVRLLTLNTCHILPPGKFLILISTMICKIFDVMRIMYFVKGQQQGLMQSSTWCSILVVLIWWLANIYVMRKITFVPSQQQCLMWCCLLTIFRQQLPVKLSNLFLLQILAALETSDSGHYIAPFNLYKSCKLMGCIPHNFVWNRLLLHSVCARACVRVWDCLCDIVVRVPGYRSRGPGFDSRVWNRVHSAWWV